LQVHQPFAVSAGYTGTENNQQYEIKGNGSDGNNARPEVTLSPGQEREQ
jgi:hypothetical protein